MELQWPLILFTTFVAWSAGLFGAQGAAALAGEGRRAQMPALIGSAALLAVGGVAVFFHLEHFERIFNGFGNPTSGITQELVCVVVVGALMVVAFVVSILVIKFLMNYIRRNDFKVFGWYRIVLGVLVFLFFSIL